ncbi:MAG: hypothetical protein M4579_007410 [Chaenotheca gracillima]|nr:MAG: hypothetical protein M4579_007410 [Chaenotheca gracillima]
MPVTWSNLFDGKTAAEKAYSVIERARAKATLVSIPYHVPELTLPVPLPSLAQIENCADVLKMLSRGCKVVRINQHYVVKFGENVDAIEGQNMLYVARHTRIPIPRVYAIYQDIRRNPRDVKTYIVMQNIHGTTLRTAWPTMAEAEKEFVAEKLKGYFKQLRKIPSEGYYGSLGPSYLRDSLFWHQGDSRQIRNYAGPFATEALLMEGMLNSYQKFRTDAMGGRRLEFYRRRMHEIFRKHKPVFSHGDLCLRNIMIQKFPAVSLPITGMDDNLSASAKLKQRFLNLRMPRKPSIAPEEGSEAFVVTIIDWEKAGWWPSYWEYALAWSDFRWKNDWEKYFERVIEPNIIVSPWIYWLRREASTPISLS